jgi:anti-anti-sigma factor
MSLKTAVNGDVVTISIDGIFDVSVYELFKEACSECISDTAQFVIDLDKTTNVDSSALGLLLLLRERTQGDKKRVKLINVGESVLSILEVAQFQQLFNIQAKS